MPVKETFLLFMDTETTGLEPGKDQVTEVASILMDLKLKEIDRIELKTKVTCEVSPEAAAINGYDPEVWAREAKHFSLWQGWLSRHVPYGNVAVAVGQNVDFDRRIIDEGYYKKPIKRFCPISYRKIELMSFSMALKVAGILDLPNVKLESVAKALGLNHTAHRAMGDVIASRDIFRVVVELLKASAHLIPEIVAKINAESDGERAPVARPE